MTDLKPCFCPKLDQEGNKCVKCNGVITVDSNKEKKVKK